MPDKSRMPGSNRGQVWAWIFHHWYRGFATPWLFASAARRRAHAIEHAVRRLITAAADCGDRLGRSERASRRSPSRGNIAAERRRCAAERSIARSRPASRPALRGPYPTPGPLPRAAAVVPRLCRPRPTFTSELMTFAAALLGARRKWRLNFTPAPHVGVGNAHGHAEDARWAWSAP